MKKKPVAYKTFKCQLLNAAKDITLLLIITIFNSTFIMRSTKSQEFVWKKKIRKKLI